jgi:hypothetical protein
MQENGGRCVKMQLKIQENNFFAKRFWLYLRYFWRWYRLAGSDFPQGTIQSHSLSILSGGDKTKLSVSGNYFKQDGVLQNTDFVRYSGRFALDHDYSKNFKITSSLVASYTKSNVAPSAIVGNLLLTPPSLPVYRTDGSFVVLSPFESALQTLSTHYTTN